MQEPPLTPTWVKFLIIFMAGTLPGVMIGRCGREQQYGVDLHARRAKACEMIKGDLTVASDCILSDGTKLHWTSHYTK